MFVQLKTYGLLDLQLGFSEAVVIYLIKSSSYTDVPIVSNDKKSLLYKPVISI